MKMKLAIVIAFIMWLISLSCFFLVSLVVVAKRFTGSPSTLEDLQLLSMAGFQCIIFFMIMYTLDRLAGIGSK